MNSCDGAYFRLVPGWAGCSPREGVIAGTAGERPAGPAALRPIASAAGWRATRSRSRDDCRADVPGDVDRLGPSYVKLGQFLATRPDVVGPDLARDLAHLQDRMATFPTAEADGHASRIRSAGRSDELFVRFRRADRGRLDRAGPSGRGARRGRSRARSRSRLSVPACASASRAISSNVLPVAHLQERFMPASRRLRPVEVAQTLAADDEDRDGSAAGSCRAFRTGAKTRQTIRASAFRRSTGSAPAATS